jgi:hypothetical protein
MSQVGLASFFAHHFQVVVVFRAAIPDKASIPRGHEQHVTTLHGCKKQARAGLAPPYIFNPRKVE